jgi:hypothetical protein
MGGLEKGWPPTIPPGGWGWERIGRGLRYRRALFSGPVGGERLGGQRRSHPVNAQVGVGFHPANGRVRPARARPEKRPRTRRGQKEGNSGNVAYGPGAAQTVRRTPLTRYGDGDGH